MAQIAIDARKYFDFGIGTYIQNLSRALSDLDSRHRYSLLVSVEDSPRVECPPNWTKQIVNFKKYSPGELMLLGYRTRKQGADLLHIPHYTLPIGLKGRSVVTVHDLIHVKFPWCFTLPQRMYAHAVLSHVARHAGAIITGSEHAKVDVVDTLHVDERKVYPIYHGIQPGFERLRDEQKIIDFKRRFQLRNPFVLYVGNIKPHKNIPTLLQAFKSIVSWRKDVELVFVGELLSNDEPLSILAQSLGITKNIRNLGRLSKDDLICSYNAAEVLVLPSLYEGFGFTAVEAMACETPVVASNAASLPEVIADAGIIFEAASPNALENALRSVLVDARLRNELVAKGKKNIQRFSWDRAARETLRVYETVLEKR
ncbi:MAG: glycosyltransferase family 1 protein [Bacteroidota bacterium]